MNLRSSRSIASRDRMDSRCHACVGVLPPSTRHISCRLHHGVGEEEEDCSGHRFVRVQPQQRKHCQHPSVSPDAWYPWA